MERESEEGRWGQRERVRGRESIRGTQARTHGVERKGEGKRMQDEVGRWVRVRERGLLAGVVAGGFALSLLSDERVKIIIRVRVKI